MITPAVKQLVGARNAALQWAATLQRNGVPIDLTNWIGRLQFRVRPGEPDPPLLDLGTAIPATAAGSALTFPTPTTGGFLLVVKPADWRLFLPNTRVATPATFAYDLLLTDPAGLTQRYAKGVLVLDEGVTR